MAGEEVGSNGGRGGGSGVVVVGYELVLGTDPWFLDSSGGCVLILVRAILGPGGSGVPWGGG